MDTARQILLYQSIGSNIRLKRGEKFLNQADLAERVGLTRTSIVNIEQGRQHPTIHLLWRIAEALDTNLFELIPTKLVSKTVEPVAEVAGSLNVAQQKGGTEAAQKLEEFYTFARAHTPSSTPSKP